MSQRTAIQMPQPVQTTNTPTSGTLQRQCACGNHTVAGGECAECAKKKHSLQRKLAIGASNDPLEREAERVAAQVLAAPTHPKVSNTPPRIQRFSGRTNGQIDTAPASVDRVLASPGRPLEPVLQHDMEQRFGHDFSRVRVYSGAAAEQSAREVNANAYTMGYNIVFGAGRFAPGTHEGRWLIAHELTHVVQQSGSDSPRIDPSKGDSDLSLMVYDTASTGEHVVRVTPAPASTPYLRRDPQDEDPDIDAIVRAAGRAKIASTATQLNIAGSEIAYLLISKFLENYTALISGIGFDGKVSGVVATKGGGGSFSLSLGKDFITGVTATNLAVRAAQIGAAFAKVGAKPREDYVFLMGEDRKGQPNQFYLAAETYYKAKLPKATMIKDRRNLETVLEYVANTVAEPIGSLYLVSHANEDGTLSFPLNSADKDNKTSVAELRTLLHPAKGGSKLPKVSGKVDVYSKVRIKGCDIGRTQQMVELLDEAFGGEGTVTAPTHEQRYDYDSASAKSASKAFRDEIVKAHPEPEIDKALKKKNPAKARADHQKAKAERQKEINAEIKARADEEQQVMDRAAVIQEFSGPMFQRPGTKLYTAAELAPEVDTFYPHLDAKQRIALVKDLIAPDRRPTSIAQSQGTYNQHGQRLDRKRLDSERYFEPSSLAEATAQLAKDFAQQKFTPKKLLPLVREKTDAGEKIVVKIEGLFQIAGQKDPVSDVFTSTSAPLTSDKELIRTSREKLGNPDRYAWRVERTHGKDGLTRSTAVAERVIAYLHHRSLRMTPRTPFDRPESDPRFYATSTFRKATP